MATNVQVLIVEDERPLIELWRQMFESARINGGMAWVTDLYASSLDDAVMYLDTRRIDAAIVDLRLASPTPGFTKANDDGVKFLRQFQRRVSGVVAVLTGQQSSEELDAYENEKIPAARLVVFDKGDDGQTKAFEWLKKQERLIGTVREARRDIEEETAELFRTSVWPRWASWMATSSSLNAALKRHMVSHLHAKLLEDHAHQAHREEWYFVPPIRSGLRTGDILNLGSPSVPDIRIIITPKCDLAREPERVHLLGCSHQPTGLEAENTLDAATKAHLEVESSGNQQDRERSAKNLAASRDIVRRYWSNSASKQKQSTHFIPSFTLISGNRLGPFWIHFDEIETQLVAGAGLESRRIAALTPEFLPSFVSRFGAYFSRFGHLDPMQT